jgi:hypothetical protein
MFFVRVNRFWCVWARVLVFVDICICEDWPGVFCNGLSDLGSGVSHEL